MAGVRFQNMGTEIIVITIANIYVFGYSVLIKLGWFLLVKFGVINSGFGIVYKCHAVLIAVLALAPSLYFLWAISGSYGFSIGYISIIQAPIILLTLLVLMNFRAWKNLTRPLN
jgi:hypothetical protein